MGQLRDGATISGSMRKCLIAAMFCLSAAVAQDAYKKPPKEILDVLNAPVTPAESLSPSRDWMILREPMSYPPIADVAQPMLRLAGLRINPKTNGPHTAAYSVRLVLKKIADGAEIKVTCRLGARISSLEWSPDGKQFAFLNTTRTQVELWVGDRTGRTRRLASNINAAAGRSAGMDARQPHAAGAPGSSRAGNSARRARRSRRPRCAGECR